MKMIIVIIHVLMPAAGNQGDGAAFILKEAGFPTMAACQHRQATAHGPWDVCAQVPEFYLEQPPEKKH